MRRGLREPSQPCWQPTPFGCFTCQSWGSSLQTCSWHAWSPSAPSALPRSCCTCRWGRRWEGGGCYSARVALCRRLHPPTALALQTHYLRTQVPHPATASPSCSRSHRNDWRQMLHTMDSALALSLSWLLPPAGGGEAGGRVGARVPARTSGWLGGNSCCAASRHVVGCNKDCYVAVADLRHVQRRAQPAWPPPARAHLTPPLPSLAPWRAPWQSSERYLCLFGSEQEQQIKAKRRRLGARAGRPCGARSGGWRGRRRRHPEGCPAQRSVRTSTHCAWWCCKVRRGAGLLRQRGGGANCSGGAERGGPAWYSKARRSVVRTCAGAGWARGGALGADELL